MANLIQIKRAITALTPSSLANGEIAYSGNTQSDSLFIGNPNGGAVTRIGGQKFNHVYNSTPGTLGSNVAIITDSNSFIDTLKVGTTTANAVVNSTSVALANSTSSIVIRIPSAAQKADSNYYLNANGDYAFVNTSAAPGGTGANTYVVFNDSGVSNTDAGFTYNKTTDLLTVANTIVTTTINVGTSNASVAMNIGANVNLTTSQVAVGNSTVNAVHTATQITVANSTNTATLTPISLTIGGMVANTTVVNSAAFTTTGITANVTGVYPTSNTSGQNLGTTTQRYVTYANTVDASGLITGGAGLTITGTANASVAMNVGANVNLSTSQVAVGNSTVNAVHTAAQITVANSTNTATLNPTTLTIGGLVANSLVVNSASFTTTGITANVTGVYPASNTSGQNLGTTTQRYVTYANTVDASGLITGAAGLTITGTANASVAMNVGANVNLSTSQINIGNSTVNTVINNISVISNTANLASAVNIGANVSLTTSQVSVGNSTVNTVINSTSISSTSGTLTVRDATVSGNLIVSGTLTSINTQQLIVNDNIIEVGSNNLVTDLVDTGIYSPAGNSTAIWYSGFARIAASSSNTNAVYRIFTSNTNPNTAATIDTTANTRTGTLISYLQSGGLVTNATNIAITANSTVNVAIIANTLTVSTPLAGTQGGTGLNTYTTEDILVANSTNGFRKLGIGAEGYVLQSVGGALVYSTLDGGTF